MSSLDTWETTFSFRRLLLHFEANPLTETSSANATHGRLYTKHVHALTHHLVHLWDRGAFCCGAAQLLHLSRGRQRLWLDRVPVDFRNGSLGLRMLLGLDRFCSRKQLFRKRKKDILQSGFLGKPHAYLSGFCFAWRVPAAVFHAFEA